jgi:hypothetical protein
MKYIYLFAFLILASSSFAQLETDRNFRFLYDLKNPAYVSESGDSDYIDVLGNAGYNSNTVTNAFTKKIIFGGFIDNGLKDQVSSRLKNVNRFGYDILAGINGRASLGSLSFVAGLYYKEHFDLKFSKDLFELAFRGNSEYAGQTLNIAPLQYRYFDAQSLYVGLEKDLNEQLRVGGGVSFIRGGRFNQAFLKRGELYTEPSGAYIDVNGDPDISYSDKNKGFLSSDGLGASLNLYGRYHIGEKSTLLLEARDIGFIRWKNLNNYSGDSTYRYDGFFIDDIFSINSGFLDRYNPDSLATDLKIQNTKKNISYLLPATFHIQYVQHVNSKISVSGGLKYTWNTNSLPRVYLKGIYYITETLIIIPAFGYGGYGRGDVELGLAKSFKDQYFVSLNGLFIEYVALPSKSSGLGLNFSFTKTF